MPETLRVNLGTAGSGTALSLALGVRASLLLPAAGTTAPPEALWLCVPARHVDAALACAPLLALQPGAPAAALWTHVAAVARAATFPVYAAVQRPGDVVLVPAGALAFSWCAAPSSAVLAARAVCADVAWEVHTAHTLAGALRETLPRLRAMGVAERDRTRAMAYHALSARMTHESASPLWRAPATAAEHAVCAEEAECWLALIAAVDSVLREERLEEDISCTSLLLPPPPGTTVTVTSSVITVDEQTEPRTYNDRAPHLRVCVSCGASIFNRAFHCFACEPDASKVAGNGDVCLECVAEGRGCGVYSHSGALVLMEQTPLHTHSATLNDAIVTFTNVCYLLHELFFFLLTPSQTLLNKQHAHRLSENHRH